MTTARRSPDDPTPIEGARRASGDHRLCLLIIGEGFVSTYPLPETGDLIIGRSPRADVVIDVGSLSRRHALLHIGATIELEDLGSANGTFVDDERLDRGVTATLGPGSMFELGTTMLIVQHSHTASRPRRIWTHGYFEARLEEECARAERTQGSFSLLRVRVDGRRRGSPRLHELVLATLRSGDILATYGPDDYEILTIDTPRGASRVLLDRIAERLSSRGANVRTGMASYPRDGRVPAALMARACAELDRRGDDEDEADIVVEAGVMKRLYRLVERVAGSDINVLILGETGVGKEIFAERIHARSSRAAGPLLRLNCAALSESLLESELFGYERGAFTGADAAKPGLLETASGGTVFLDEIGDMPRAIQAKLLRVLEERCVRRVGGLDSSPIDIRVVAATHRDLEAEVAAGRFRQDLFFRINGISIVVAPLRHRTEEIAALAQSFVAASCRRLGVPEMRIAEPALRAMCRYEWPGNVRELRNVIERAVVLCRDGTITPDHLPADKMSGTFEMRRMPTPPPAAAERTPAGDDVVDLKAGMKEREREIIREALERENGNQTRAARLLGISRRTLISRIEEYDLPRPRKRTRGPR